MAANLTRRGVLRAGAGITVASAVSAGCGNFLSMDPDVDKDNGAARAGYKGKEAPMLAELVKRRKLPALADRLPADPVVIKPYDGPGVFGGELREGTTSPTDGAAITYVGGATLVEYDPVASEIVPGLAESWDISESGKVYTFHLRRGVKWSDGHPFTTDDLIFANEHVYHNKTLNPTYPAYLMRGGEEPKITKIDDHTIRFAFTQTHGLLLKLLAFMDVPQRQMLCPAHYMKRFLPEFTPVKQLNAKAKKRQLPAWNDLYLNRDDVWQNPDRPTLNAFRIVQPAGTSGTLAVAERNPFYWKTDEQGRQLPYLDRISWTILNSESLALRAAGGELDFGGAAVLGFQEVPLLIKSSKRSNYHVARWNPDGFFVAIYLNMTPKDKALGALFQNIDFRAGLSHAINRDEINEALAAGQASIEHPCGQEGDEYFIKGMGRRFIDYDLAEADRRLDAAGCKKGSDGYRRRPDGKPLHLTMITFDVGLGIPGTDVYEFVQRYWAKVGVRMSVKVVSTDLWYQRTPAGDYELAGYPPAGYRWDIDPLWYVPTSSLSYFAPLYGKWYETNGEQGIKPTGDFRKLQVLYDELKNTVDTKKQLALGRQILKLHDENVWILGTVRPPFSPMIVNNDLTNVRPNAIASFRTGYENATRMYQVSYQHPRMH